MLIFCAITGEDVVFGFENSSYTVNEDDGFLTVCARVSSGTIGNRTFIIDVQTNDNEAMCKLRYVSQAAVIS